MLQEKEDIQYRYLKIFFCTNYQSGVILENLQFIRSIPIEKEKNEPKCSDLKKNIEKNKQDTFYTQNQLYQF